MFVHDALFVGTGVLGALGSLAIIGVHLLLPTLRSPTRNALVFLSVADLAQGLFFCVYAPAALRDRSFCSFHTAWGIFAAASSFFWTACTAYVVFRTVTFPDTPIHVSEWGFFHLLSWGYPLAVATHGVLNAEGTSFEYPFDNGQQGWFMCMGRPFQTEILEYQAPLLGCWLFTGVMYALARHSLDRMPFFVDLQDRTHGGHELQLRTKLVLVPLVFVLLRVWSLVDMLFLWHHPQNPTLLLLRALCDPLQGFCNAVIFLAMTSRVKQAVHRALCGRRWPGVPLESSDLTATAPLAAALRGQPCYTIYTSGPDLSFSSK